MLERIKDQFGTPAAIAGVGGVASAMVPEQFGWVLKGAVLLFAGMFSFIVYFLKREHETIHAKLEKNATDIVASNLAAAARASAIEYRIQELQSALQTQMREAQGQSNSRIYGRINDESRDLTHRITVIETTLGLDGRRKRRDPDPEQGPKE